MLQVIMAMIKIIVTMTMIITITNFVQVSLGHCQVVSQQTQGVKNHHCHHHLDHLCHPEYLTYFI